MIKIEKQLLTLNQDIAGQEIGIPVYRLSPETADAQRTVYIQSAVHAAEMQGSAVILKLIQKLQECHLNANFVLVPNCNPFGRTQRAGEYLQGRFDATNGNNWNRFYHYDEQQIEAFFSTLDLPKITEAFAQQGSKNAMEDDIVFKLRLFLKQQLENKLESQWGVNTAQYLNSTLQNMAIEADLVLDLHTGPSSTRHIYSPNFLAQQATQFRIETVISIPEKFAGALDEASFTPLVKLAELFAKQGLTFEYRVQAYTVELGSQENICLEQAKMDADGILNYLQTNQFIDGFKPLPAKDVTITDLSQYRTLFSKYAGMVEYLAKPGQIVQKGQVLARVLNSLEFDTQEAIKEIVSPVSGIVILHYPSAAVQIGTQLFKIAAQ